MDIGGHRFFSKDERIMDWWKTVLPLQGAPSYDDKKLGRDHDMEPGGPESGDGGQGDAQAPPSVPYLLEPPLLRLPDFAQPQHVEGHGLQAHHGGRLQLPEVHVPQAAGRQSGELLDINRFGRKLYSMFFEGYTEKLWGRHPSQISADWGAQRVKGLSIMGVLKNAFQKLLPKKRSNAEVETSLIGGVLGIRTTVPASCGRPSSPIAPPPSRC